MHETNQNVEEKAATRSNGADSSPTARKAQARSLSQGLPRRNAVHDIDADTAAMYRIDRPPPTVL